MGESMRINRFLAWAGVASRREADKLVRAGRVNINGEIVDAVGVSIDLQSDKVFVDGRRIDPPVAKTIIFHKPAGYLVSRRSQGGKPLIFSLLPAELQGLQPVGRLDFDTDGVLLLTNDGELSRRLQHPRYRIERVYPATVRHAPETDRIRQIRFGVNLGDKTPARADLRILRTGKRESVVEIRIREGRKREVKRLLAWAGTPVLRLTRKSFAGLETGQLTPGRFRTLRRGEINKLRAMVGLVD